MRSTTPFRHVLTAAALLLGGAASAQSGHEGAGAETPMTCENDEVHITGASNVIAVDGPCRLLLVEGAGNTVSVDLTAHAAIRVTGASNRIT